MYSSFGPPSIIVGIGFESKISLGTHDQVEQMTEEEKREKIDNFYELFLYQRSSLLRNQKFMLASLSMAGYCFTVTGLQYFFTDYLMSAINIPNS